MSDLFLENVDYVFKNAKDDSGLMNIKLVSGEYVGVEYRYGKVSVEEDKESDKAYLLFEFDVIDPAENDLLEENMDFKNHIGVILQNIMMKSIETNQK